MKFPPIFAKDSSPSNPKFSKWVKAVIRDKKGKIIGIISRGFEGELFISFFKEKYQLVIWMKKDGTWEKMVIKRKHDFERFFELVSDEL